MDPLPLPCSIAWADAIEAAEPTLGQTPPQVRCISGPPPSRRQGGRRLGSRSRWAGAAAVSAPGAPPGPRPSGEVASGGGRLEQETEVAAEMASVPGAGGDGPGGHRERYVYRLPALPWSKTRQEARTATRTPSRGEVGEATSNRGHAASAAASRRMCGQARTSRPPGAASTLDLPASVASASSLPLSPSRSSPTRASHQSLHPRQGLLRRFCSSWRSPTLTDALRSLYPDRIDLRRPAMARMIKKIKRCICLQSSTRVDSLNISGGL